MVGVRYFLLLSCCGLAVTVQAQSCSNPTAGSNMNLKDQFINQAPFQSGTRVSFACNVGYEPAGGSASITCSSGTWTLLTLKCERKNCGAAGEILNGQVDYPQGTEFGDKAVFSCDTGYNMVGQKQMICGDKGWNGRLPECQVVTCGPPPQIVNGSYGPIVDEEYRYRDVIQYMCKTHHTLVGPKSRSCSEDGTFMPDSPTCQLILCKDPAVDNADWMIRPPYIPTSTVTFNCRSGHTMKGEPTQTCDKNARWSPGLPTCEPVTCDPPPQIENGNYSPNSETYKYRDVLQYSCKTGLKLVGQKSRTCSEDGTFKPDPPTCQRIHCKDPAVENADWTISATFQCRPGYVLKGKSTQTCDVNGRWSPELPTCELILCKDPAVDNADWIRRPPYIPTSTVTFQCKSGHTMRGEPTQTCDVNGRWSPGLPTCERVGCQPPPEIVNGTFSPNKKIYNHGDVIQYSCKTHHVLVGKNSQTCLKDGTFKPNPPTCQLILCKDPAVANADWIRRPPYIPTSTVTFQCKAGHTMRGEPTQTCDVNGRWSPGLPTCKSRS